ncbi:PDZ domain-containing protein [bacterium]|nr:PDZ domain-containing protein [bacterium]
MSRLLRQTGLLLLSLVVAQSQSAVLRAEARSSSETIDYVMPRMVKIFGAGGLQSLAAYGTGFLVSQDGHIVTVWSHVLDPDEVIVVLNDGRRFTAKVLGAEPHLDLAVLKLNIENRDVDLPHFSLTNEIASASEGTRVLAFSNMFKVATGDEPVSVMHGVIAAKTKLQARRGAFEVPYDGSVYVIDAATNNSGAAGGLLTTREGRLLGMIGRELRNAETNTWVNYSIPLTNLSDAVQQIISGNFRSSTDEREGPVAARNYDPTDFGIVMVPDVVYRTPAYVDRTLRDSVARVNGLQPNDLVLFVDDELVQSIREMKAAIGRLEAGDTLRLTIRREDQLKTFEFRVPKK